MRRSRVTFALAVGAVLVVGGGAARAEAPRLVSSPSITGRAVEGDTLVAQPGTYAGAEPPFAFAYEWQRCNIGGAECVPVGVRQTSYTVTAADVGFRLRTWVLVTGQDCEWISAPPPPHRVCTAVTVGVPSELTAVVAANPLRPRSSRAPTISGEAEERSTLTAEDGGWTGAAPMTTARRWERCDSGGNECSPIADATAATYVVGRDDVGRTLRVVVTASNALGVSPPVASPATDTVRAFLPRPGREVLGAALVELPERLQIDRVVLTPARLRLRTPVVAKVRVSDTRGFRIRGAVVRLTATPAGLVAPIRHARTGSDGWAKVRLRPTARAARRGGSIRLLVRAFRAGEKPTGGVAAQRIARLPLAAPAGG